MPEEIVRELREGFPEQQTQSRMELRKGKADVQR